MLRKLIRVWIVGIVFPLYAIAGQPSVKITHGPYLQNLSENEVTVVWTTDKTCKSWVEFSKKEDGKNFYSQLPRFLPSIVTRGKRVAALSSCFG